jgi:ABC-type oligopeptide transport system ATPase subunit
VLLRLETPDSGRVAFDGQDWLATRGENLRRARKDIQAVFQDPLGSLDPRRTVGYSIGEALAAHGLAADKKERDERVADLLSQVGLPAGVAARRPVALSGGQRQRVTIARAIATAPKFVVCDEATSALDVSVQAQIINLLSDLQESLGVSYLFISHSLATVRHIADRVGVMYLGKIVEEAPADRIFTTPRHPYTRALLASVPVPDPTASRPLPDSAAFRPPHPNAHPAPAGSNPPDADLTSASVPTAAPNPPDAGGGGGTDPAGNDPHAARPLGGEIPSATHLPSGCRFRLRCPLAEAICAESEPPLAVVSGTHSVACHFPG